MKSPIRDPLECCSAKSRRTGASKRLHQRSSLENRCHCGHSPLALVRSGQSDCQWKLAILVDIRPPHLLKKVPHVNGVHSFRPPGQIQSSCLRAYRTVHDMIPKRNLATFAWHCASPLQYMGDNFLTFLFCCCQQPISSLRFCSTTTPSLSLSRTTALHSFLPFHAIFARTQSRHYIRTTFSPFNLPQFHLYRKTLFHLGTRLPLST